MSTPITPQLGDSVFLKTVTANLNIFGVISDLDTPDQVSATLELFGGNGQMSLAALMGPAGPAGTNAPLPKLQPNTLLEPDDLPQNLTADDVDAGKYWIIEDRDPQGNVTGSKAYMWNRDHYQAFMMGSEGPAGPVPAITPNVVLLNPDDPNLTSHITVTGDDFHPTWTLYLKAPRGPMGPQATISGASDFDGTIAPEVGDVPTYTASGKWKPTPLAGLPSVKWWTVPESNFTNGKAINSTRFPIGSFTLPALDWDCKLHVTGKVHAVGIELDSTPLLIGCEVRLGNPNTGQVIARGYGNITGYTYLEPGASTAQSPNTAITPDNEVGLIPAHTTGTASTIYVNLFNDGLSAIYDFDRAGASLSVMAVPV